MVELLTRSSGMFLSLNATVFIIPEPSRLLCSRVRASVLIFKFFFSNSENAVYAAHNAGIKHESFHNIRVFYSLAKTLQRLQQEEPMPFKNKQLMSFKEIKKTCSCKQYLAACIGKEIQRRGINSMTSTEFRETPHRVDARRLRAYL